MASYEEVLKCGHGNEITNPFYMKTIKSGVAEAEKRFLQSWGKEGYKAVEKEECPKCREQAGFNCTTEFSKRELKAPCHIERYRKWLRRVGRL